MSSANTTGKAVASPLAAISLKLVGAITIIAALIDFLILIIPPNFLDAQWQLATTTQLVDRGIVPLVGIALVLTGAWIDSNVGVLSRSRSLLVDARFWVCLLSSFLGLLFVVLTVLHPNNVRLTSRQALERVDTEVGQVTSQIEQRFDQQRTQLGSLLQNEDQLQQAVEQGQLTQEQLAFVEQFRNDPAALDDFLEQQLGQARQQAQTQIGSRRQEAEQQIRREALKSGFRVATSSLLLAIGYTVIGWLGLRRLLAMSRTA
ncbi:hormogonium polysaccharide biosynthesis protein HpsJ [Almyronema epifaneia]|uniref:HpsJ family protein n=1 Tax=Almyronema epifaneia S1 TaxID=2991925 RepID=A0ABW6IER3_9CYAN